MPVLLVVVPTQNRKRLLWLQHVSRRRVVQDHGVLGVAANLAHVFGEDAVHVGAVLPEQAHGAESAGVHFIH